MSTLHHTRVTLHSLSQQVSIWFYLLINTTKVAHSKMRRTITMLVLIVFNSCCIPCREQLFSPKDYDVRKSYHRVPEVKTIWFKPAESSEFNKNTIRKPLELEFSEFSNRRKSLDMSSDRQAQFMIIPDQISIYVLKCFQVFIRFWVWRLYRECK